MSQDNFYISQQNNFNNISVYAKIYLVGTKAKTELFANPTIRTLNLL